MRFYNLVHELYIKFVPTPEIEAVSMQNEAVTQYGQWLQEMKDTEAENEMATVENRNRLGEVGFKAIPIKPFTWKMKLLKIAENVWVKYGIGVLYSILVPAIQNFMNGSNKEEDSPEDRRMAELEEELYRLKHR
jgi:hypothetical protein